MLLFSISETSLRTGGAWDSLDSGPIRLSLREAKSESEIAKAHVKLSPMSHRADSGCAAEGEAFRAGGLEIPKRPTLRRWAPDDDGACTVGPVGGLQDARGRA